MKKGKDEQAKAKAPVFFKRVGSVKLSLFENAAAEGGQVFSNLALVRRYRAADMTWHDSNVLNGVVDAVSAAECLRCALEFMHRREEGKTENEEQGGKKDEI